MDISNNGGGSFDALLGVVPAALSYLAFNVPFWLTIVYLIFGSKFFLFAWLDEVLVFLIMHWVSNITPLIHIFSIFLLVLYIALSENGIGVFDVLFSIMIVFESLIGYFYTQRTMESSGDACRHLNP